jgi:hypothetical protein
MQQPVKVSAPEALAMWQRQEIDKWGALIKGAGIKAE